VVPVTIDTTATVKYRVWSGVGVEIVWTALWYVWIVSNIVTSLEPNLTTAGGSSYHYRCHKLFVKDRMWSRVGVEIVWIALWCVWIVSNIVTIGLQRKQTEEPLDIGHLATLVRATRHIWTGCNRPPVPALSEHLALLFTDAPYSYAGLLSRNPTPAVQRLGYRASVHGRGTWFLFFAVSSNVTPSYIQDVSRLVDITAGGDFLGLCDQKTPCMCKRCAAWCWIRNVCCFRMILTGLWGLG
jgi:hypothetical protein